MRTRTSILGLPTFAALPFLASVSQAQHGLSTYVVPDGMVKGGQYIDHFLPMKPNAPLRSDVWGVDAVKPRAQRRELIDGLTHRRGLLNAHGSVKAGAITNGLRELTVQVENFGLAKSAATRVSLQFRPNGREPLVFTAPLPPLEPSASADMRFNVPAELALAGAAPQVEIRIEGHPADDFLSVSLPKLL